jgi:hypothetical protein
MLFKKSVSWPSLGEVPRKARISELIYSINILLLKRPCQRIFIDLIKFSIYKNNIKLSDFLAFQISSLANKELNRN